MDEARQIFLELKLELLKLIFLQGVLNAALLFLVAYLVFIVILGLPAFVYLLLGGLLYLVGYCLVELRKIDYRYIEEREEGLRDVLRTAYDNMETSGMMVRALIQDLALRMREVQPAKFFNGKRLAVKLFLVFLLAFSIPLVTSYRVDLHRFGDQISKYTAFLPSFDEPPTDQQFDDVEFSPTDDIYGDPSVALLGDEEVVIKLATSLNNIDFTKQTDASSREFTDQESVDQVYASQDASYEESISREKRQLVQDYFKQIQQ